MSLEYEALTDLSPIVVDIETAPLLNARDFIDPPDLVNLTPPGNYTKPETIAKWIEEERPKRLAAYERECTEKSALDFNTARIVAIGYWTEGLGLVPLLCKTETDERIGLAHFWQQVRQRLIVGFYIRNFDLPMLIQRSRYLGIQAPHIDLGRYARASSVIDLHDVLTFNDMRAESLMPRSVHAYCRRIGIPVEDAIKGADIPALVAAGEWDKVEAHVCSDVQLEVALAKWLGVVQPQPVGAVL